MRENIINPNGWENIIMICRVKVETKLPKENLPLGLEKLFIIENKGKWEKMVEMFSFPSFSIKENTP